MEVSIPPELVKDEKTIDFAINTLKMIKKIKQGRFVQDMNSIQNKLKFYLLDYLCIEDIDETIRELSASSVWRNSMEQNARLEEAITVDELLRRVKDKHDKILYEKVWFSLRAMRLRWISPKTVDLVKYCIALSEEGYPATTPLLTVLAQRTPTTVRERLHLLGDKNVLTFIRGSRDRVQKWFLSDVFKKVYYEGLDPFKTKEPELEEDEDIVDWFVKHDIT